jgi:hypothetical protein
MAQPPAQTFTASLSRRAVREAVACPKCIATVGARCRDEQGLREANHRERVIAAERAGVTEWQHAPDLATDKQVEYLRALRERCGMTDLGLTAMSRAQAAAEIGKLNSLLRHAEDAPARRLRRLPR